MKGIVFTGFLEMVEQKYGFVVLDTIIQNSHLSTQGIYTSVGTYSFNELIELLQQLSKEIDSTVDLLLREFSYYFFDLLKQHYKSFFEKASDTFEMFEKLDTYIHPEVKKLYPQAELPKFDATRLNHNTLELIYSSEKMMATFAQGLMEKCAEYFQENIVIQRENIDEYGKKVRFLIIRE